MQTDKKCNAFIRSDRSGYDRYIYIHTCSTYIHAVHTCSAYMQHTQTVHACSTYIHTYTSTYIHTYIQTRIQCLQNIYSQKLVINTRYLEATKTSIP